MPIGSKMDASALKRDLLVGSGADSSSNAFYVKTPTLSIDCNHCTPRNFASSLFDVTEMSSRGETSRMNFAISGSLADHFLRGNFVIWKASKKTLIRYLISSFESPPKVISSM